MPALFLVLGLAAVVAIAAASGHSKKAAPAAQRASPPIGTVELDHGMPDAVVRQVLSALAHNTSGASLEELAHQLESKYPLSARELRAKAATLHAPPAVQAPATASHTSAPDPTAASHAVTPNLAHAPEADAHELQAASVLQAAMRALVEEPDPVVLDGFAESIRTLYPTAATLLLARAHALRTATTSAHAKPATAAAVFGVTTMPAATHPSAAPASHENAASPAVATESQS
jgi:hypothetical protein